MTIVKNDTYSEELMKDFVSSNITGEWGKGEFFKTLFYLKPFFKGKNFAVE